MAKPYSSSAVTVILITLFVLATAPSAYALGSGATLAVSSASTTVCGIVASQPKQSIQCYRRGQTIPVGPNVSFSSISGGRNLLCGLRSGGHSLLCWDTANISSSSFAAKSFYYNDNTVPLENLSVGDYQICATVVGTGSVNCWRGNGTFQLPSGSDGFASISSGFGFSCGILRNSHQVRCWGNNTLLANQTQRDFGNMSMTSIVTGGSHVCGLNSTGFVVCKGNNDYGQLNVPSSNSAWEFSTLALGESHSCAIRRTTGLVMCWGGGGEYSLNVTQAVSFETIASGSNFICGLTTDNFSIICWGPGWPGEGNYSSGAELPLPATLPGPCNQSNSSCECGVYPQSQRLCSGLENICKPCLITEISIPPQQAPHSPPSLPLPPPVAPGPTGSPPSSSVSLGFKWGAFAFCMISLYCMWSGRACRWKKKKLDNSVLPTFARAASPNNGTSSTIKHEGTRIMSHQRYGTSSKHTGRAEKFPLPVLAAATDYFSPANKIGCGSFGVVYRSKLTDGREVAIKRGYTDPKKKRFQEKRSAFYHSELEVLTRLHHKHLVRLVGYCEEGDERLLAYDYMKNGALFDHLHDKNNVGKSNSVLNSWKTRINIALDAARGIEYLHNYAVPPIIHRHIKSSNILLDGNWTARVSDLGCDYWGWPVEAAGTAESDVYGVGVVLLELLTGKKAVFCSEDEGRPTTVVDFAVPAIMGEELVKVLDSRVGPPTQNEREAVELMADTAMRCVNFQGEERPTMAEIVNNLEVALALFDLAKFIFGKAVSSQQ